MDWYIGVLKKYAVFSGRARRTEYWMFVLFNCIAASILGLIDAFAGTTTQDNVGLLGSLYSLAVFVPSLAVTVRRLHDTGRSGAWILIGLVPIVGWVILLVYLVTDGQPGTNQYGPNPKEPGAMGAAATGVAGTGGAGTSAPAGWYPDPTGRHQMRYWDSRVWTSHVSDAGTTSTDPIQ